MYYSDFYDYGVAAAGSSVSWRTICLVLTILTALAAVVLAFLFIMPAKKRDKMSKMMQMLHDVCNFNGLIIELILKALYIFATVYVFVGGFFDIFLGYEWYMGILTMILGPIVVRIGFELTMLFIILVKNVIQINKKLKYPEDADTADTFSFDYSKLKAEKKEEAAPASGTAFCTGCGNQIAADDVFCPHCGKSTK